MNKFEPKKVLITGGCGFIGSNFINYYHDKYPEVFIVNLDKLDYCADINNIKNQNNNYKFIKGNLNNHELINNILFDYEIDSVIHFAAQTHVDNSFGNSIQFTHDNILGTHTLLECCRQYGKIQRFLHISTDEVYGEVDLEHPGCSEKSLLNPTNPYAATKASAEFIVRSYYYSFKLPIIITRGNNVYGPNQYPEKLIPKFIKLLKDNKKCPIHGNGESRRNFIHSYDVASAVDTILSYGQINNIYNIGTSNEYSVLDIAKKLIKLIKDDNNYNNWIEYVEDRNFNDFRYAIDNQELKKLGWDETMDFNSSIDTLIKYY